MNRSRLFSALVAASFLTTGAMAQGAAPKPKTTKPAVSTMATTDTTKKKPTPKHKKVKPAKPDTTKTKKPN